MARRTAISRQKALNRVKFNLIPISRAVERLNVRSNDTPHTANFHLLTMLSILRFQNIRLQDIGMDKLNSVNERSTRNIILVFFYLLTADKGSKTMATKTIGIDDRTGSHIIDSLISAGYVSTFTHRMPYFLPRPHYKLFTYLQLTSKGYDKVNFIVSLLIDQRLTNPDYLTL